VDLVFALGEWLQLHPHISGLVFVAVYAVVMAVGIPGGILLTLSAGLLFGTLPGAMLATAGAALAALATHALIRTAFGRWLDSRADSSRYSLRSLVSQGDTLLLLLPRLIPVIPFFLLNVALTAAGVPLRTYMWTTVAGIIPVVFLFTRIGSTFRDLQELSAASLGSLLLSPDLLVPLCLLALMTSLGWLYFRRRKVV